MRKIRNIIRRALLLSLLICLLVQLTAVPALGSKEQMLNSDTTASFNLFLPQVMKEYSPTPPGVTLETGVTNSTGVATFNDFYANIEARVTVKNQSGSPIPGMDVHFFSNGDTAWVFVVDPNEGVGSSYYYPGWAEINYSLSMQSQQISAPNVPILIAIPIILIVGGYGAYLGYKFGENPPRIDLELGYTRVCMTYEQFKNTVNLGEFVLAVVTVGHSSAFWHAAKKAVSESVVHTIVLDAGSLIDGWGQNNVAGWPGEWCFRKSWFNSVPWYFPETDLIRPHIFIAELRWDKNDTDVDLHIFDSLGNHAYYADRDGVPGGLLDRDDIDGYGPEIYTQMSLGGAAYYEVWVHYYSDHGYGPTTATVEIFDISGLSVRTFQRQLSDEDEWYVYTVTPYPNQQITVTEERTTFDLQPSFLIETQLLK